MGIWNWLTGRVLKSAKVGGWNILPWQSGRVYYPDYSHKSLIEKYQSYVYACAHVNAISCAQIPLRLYTTKPTRKSKSCFQTRQIERVRRAYLEKSATTQSYFASSEDVEEVTEHPFLELMTNVNEFMNQFDLFETTWLYQELTGNAYWNLSFNGTGLPDQIWPLGPQYVKIIPDKQKFISHYEFSISPTEKHKVKPEGIVHFKYVNPKNAYYGMGPLEACMVAADLHAEMNLFETALFVNRAIPDIAIITPKETGIPPADEQRRVEKGWKQRFGGTKKTGKPVWLFGGADIKNLSLTPKEMAFLQGRKATRGEVAAVYGVPESKITTENVNRANAEAGDYSYMKDTVKPRLHKMEQKLNEQLLPKYDERLFVAFDNPVPEDKEFRLKETKSHLDSGYSSINEERQKDGQEPVEWGEIPILPTTVAPLGTAVEAPEEPVKAKTKAPRRLPPLNHPTNFINEPFVESMREYFGEMGSEVLTAFDKDMEIIASATEESRELDAIHIKIRAEDYVSSWIDMEKWNGKLSTRLLGYHSGTLLEGGGKAIASVLPGAEFDPINPRVFQALHHHREGAVRQVNHNVAKRLRSRLALGIAEGEGITGLRKRVEDVFDGLEKYQSEVIARTETIWAWNEGAVQGYIQSGVVERKEWVASGDPRTCDWCLDIDGTIVGVAEDYYSKGDEHRLGGMKFDYSDVGHPPIHPMCRCTIVPVIEGV